MKVRNTIPVITATELAAALGGRRSGHGWMARCPAHYDREPSVSVSGGIWPAMVALVTHTLIARKSYGSSEGQS